MSLNIKEIKLLTLMESGSLQDELASLDYSQQLKYTVELYVLNEEDSILDSYVFPLIQELNKSIFILKDKMILNPGMHLRELGYSNGTFKFKYNFVKDVFGNQESQELFFKLISPSRTEIDCNYNKNSVLDIDFNKLIDIYINDEQFKKLNCYINLGMNRLQLIVNGKKTKTDSLLLKLYESLNSDISTNDTFWISEKIVDSYEDSITLLTEEKEDLSQLNVLRPPIISKTIDKISKDFTPLESFRDLTTNDDEIRDTIMRYFFSSSLIEGIELNIDYRKFENFINFSSATERLKNFKNKLYSIEFNNRKIYELINISASAMHTAEISSSIQTYKLNKRKIIDGLDGYEKYLYFESASYISSSIGEYENVTWPKRNFEKPYTLYSVTSSEAIEWYNKQLQTASLFDNNNINALVNFIPLEIKLDILNKDYEKTINMVAHQYDIIFNYIKHMTYIYKYENSIGEGIAKDLILDSINNSGYNLFSGHALKTLSEFVIKSGSIHDFSL